MDTPIKGTVKFVNQPENGFTIAYLSGRPRAALAATKQSLQRVGSQLMLMNRTWFSCTAVVEVFQTSQTQEISSDTSQNKFDGLFFDDTPEFREAAKSLFIPGDIRQSQLTLRRKNDLRKLGRIHTQP